MKLFPDGFGTRAFLATIIVGGAVGTTVALIVALFMNIDTMELAKFALTGLFTLANMSVGFYFLDKKNGGKK